MRLADYSAEVGFHLHSVHPALFYGGVYTCLTKAVGNLAFYRMLVAATAEIQIALARCIVEIYISVDDGIFGVEDGTVI